VGEVQARYLDELPFGADALEEHDQLEFEEDDRIDARPAPLGIQIPHPLADEAHVERGLQMAVEVVSRDEGFERDGDRLVKTTGFGRAEHDRLPSGCWCAPTPRGSVQSSRVAEATTGV